MSVLEKEVDTKIDRPVPVVGLRNVLVTAALPYVNSVPHLGNLVGSTLSADVYARFCRARGYPTLYVCGTDEYGTATEIKAAQEKVSPQQLCDIYHLKHREIYEWFGIKFDVFGRTSHPIHTEIAQDIFKQCDENKHLYQESENQAWCTVCNRFLADRFVQGICPRPECKSTDARGDQCDKCGHLLNADELIHPRCSLCSAAQKTTTIATTTATTTASATTSASSEIEFRQSKQLFLDLPALEYAVREWLAVGSEINTWSANANSVTHAWLDGGLKARSITRDLKWGVPVLKAGFEDKSLFVWFEAPIGYMSITASIDFDRTKQAWPHWRDWWQPIKSHPPKSNAANVELYQFMGKDNIVFHSLIFPATLLATKANYTMVRHLAATEYLQYENDKFSKSRGLGVFGDDAMSTGVLADCWRYYLMAIRPETADSNFSWQQFADCINSELIATFGNLFHRTFSLVYTRLGAIVPAASFPVSEIDDHEEVEKKFRSEMIERTAEYIDRMERVQLRDAQKTVMLMANAANRFINATQPFKLLSKPEDQEKLHRVVRLLMYGCRWIAICAHPFMPATTFEIFRQLNLPLPVTSLALAPKITPFHYPDNPIVNIPNNHKTSPPSPLFKPLLPSQIKLFQSKFKKTI
jgi:methionyl-tRNA synthetase